MMDVSEACTPDHSYSRHPAGTTELHTAESQTTEMYTDEISALKQRIQELSDSIKYKDEIIRQRNDTIKELQEKLNKHFHPHSILANDAAVQFYTGLKDRQTYDYLFQYLHRKAEQLHYWDGAKKCYEKPRYFTGKARSISVEVEFLAVMMRLKLGLLVHDIASRIGISLPQFSRMFTSWIRFMRLELEAIQRFPSRMEVRNFMPSECKKYTNIRVIIDCTEFLIETPSSLTAQRETWSAYKSHNTYKVLVGCTPDGVLSYISRLYGGAASDKFITVDSGFIEHLQAGDTIIYSIARHFSTILERGYCEHKILTIAKLKERESVYVVGAVCNNK